MVGNPGEEGDLQMTNHGFGRLQPGLPTTSLAGHPSSPGNGELSRRRWLAAQKGWQLAVPDMRVGS